MGIKRKNAHWEVNGKRINSCFGFEQTHFTKFLDFMQSMKNSEKKTLIVPVKITKEHNYKFKK